MSFGDDIKEEMVEIKKNVEKLQSESLAYEIVKYQRKQNKRLFIAWLLTFIAFIGLLSYTIYLLNDIQVIETSESENYDINQTSGDGGNNNFINGNNNEVNN